MAEMERERDVSASLLDDDDDCLDFCLQRLPIDYTP